MIVFGRLPNPDHPLEDPKPNHLFSKLPYYFKENDNGSKVIAGYEDEGRLERYFEIFCAELDAEVSPYIDDLPDIVDAEALSGLTRANPLEFLNVISDSLGNPPDIGLESEYVTLLRHVIWIYKTKGTKKSLELFLAIFGYGIDSLTEASTTKVSYDADTPIEYDVAPTPFIYDVGFAFYSDWELVITDYPGTTTGDPATKYDAGWLDLLKEAIQTFISPIFATLTSVTYV